MVYEQEYIDRQIAAIRKEISIVRYEMMQAKVRHRRLGLSVDHRLSMKVLSSRSEKLYDRLYRWKELSPSIQRNIKINQILDDR